jgi:plasmid stabilization system protein ParE
MEREVVITKRFRNNTLRVYEYLLKEFSAATAFSFIDNLEKRIEFIAKNPTIGKESVKKKNVRSLLFTPHNQIFYRLNKNKIEILSLFDRRRNPGENPY